MNHFESFKQLHHNPTPLLLGNIWDLSSARILEASGYKAIGVSSSALSNSLGFDDGENLPFETLLQFTKKVAQAVQIPLSIDMEAGYSRSIAGIIENIDKLHDAGAVGINLEDTIPGTTREFRPAVEFRHVLSAVSEHIARNNLQIFLNVRTDGFLLNLPEALDETLTRVELYENSGADGIFVPCITRRDEIKAVVSATKLPVNVMCVPGLPDFDELGSLGIRRISMGPFLFNKANRAFEKLAAAVINDNNFSSIL
jgi:2-methylisocitrate lyase-like PEP mutase family enzyme